MGLTCAKPYEGSSDWSKDSWFSPKTESAGADIRVLNSGYHFTPACCPIIPYKNTQGS